MGKSAFLIRERGSIMLEKLFKLQSKKTTVRTEIIAGLTTFLAMAYILGVNPSILGGDLTGMDAGSVFLATAISSAIACVLMGVLANYPIGLAPGMGVNALFTYTVCLQYGYTFEEALAAVFISGVIFIVISVTGIRKLIINAIPKNMKLAIGAGIGFFIAFLALKNAEIIVANESTFLALGNFKDPVVLLAVFGILVTIALMVRGINAAPFYGLVITAVAGIILGLTGIEGMPALPDKLFSADFSMNTAGAFLRGMSGLFAHDNWFLVIFSFLFVDFFDTAGTLVAVGNNIGLVDENGEMEGVEKALLADSLGTVVGAALGTSTVTSFVESGAGVAAGGRTGLTAVTVGVCFILSIFVSPLILSVAVNAVTAPAIFVVGILMAKQLKEIDWQDTAVAAYAFITILFMVLAYSISDGLAMGFIIYGLTMLCSGRAKEVSPICWGLILIFILYFCK